MANVIHKYQFELAPQSIQKCAMPKGARLLTAQLQNGLPVLWAIVDTESPMVMRQLGLAWTGHPAFNGEWVATLQTAGGTYVWHLFDLGEENA